MKIKMTEEKRSEIRNVLLGKKLRLEYTSTVLKIRLKQATRDLENAQEFNEIQMHHLEQLQKKSSLTPIDSNKGFNVIQAIRKLKIRIFNSKVKIEGLMQKVLFELPLAIATEKAEMVIIQKFMKDEPLFFETKVA